MPGTLSSVTVSAEVNGCDGGRRRDGESDQLELTRPLAGGERPAFQPVARETVSTRSAGAGSGRAAFGLDDRS